MTPFVVDANAIHAFQEERIKGEHASASEAIDEIFRRHCIALDHEGHCVQEWISCAGGTYPFALTDWISDQIVAGKIEYFELAPNNCRKNLLGFGLPQKDHKWVRLAVGCGGKRLVTEDIDFFDPTKKHAASAVKEALRESRSGPCAKSIRRTFDVSVFCLRHVRDEAAAAP